MSSAGVKGVPAGLLNVLRGAAELQRQIDALIERQDALLEPIATMLMARIAAAGAGERSGLESQVNSFPAGFYRSELRVALIRRFGAE